MKIEDVTKSCQNDVKMIRVYSPNKSPEIKIYESGPTRFIHEISDDKQLLSISCSARPVIEKEWIAGIKEIMHLVIEDIVIDIGTSGVVYIRVSGESLTQI